jgi:hypothetical protein
MTALEERIKLSQLVHGKDLVDYFRNNSDYMVRKYAKSDQFCQSIPISEIQIGYFHHFHYDDKSNWMKYSPVFVCDFKQFANYMIIYALNFNFIPLRFRSAIFEKFISEKDFENNRPLAVNFQGLYNELRKYGFEYAIVEYNSINLKLVHRINLSDDKSGDKSENILPRFLYSAHPVNKYDPSKLYQIWSTKIKTRDKRHQEIALSTLNEFLDVKNEISEKFEVLRGHIQRLRDNLG